jgi:hypothetical protein
VAAFGGDGDILLDLEIERGTGRSDGMTIWILQKAQCVILSVNGGNSTLSRTRTWFPNACRSLPEMASANVNSTAATSTHSLSQFLVTLNVITSAVCSKRSHSIIVLNILWIGFILEV